MSDSTTLPSTVAVGLDVGTTRIKAVVVDPDGREFNVAEQPTPWQRLNEGTQLDAKHLAEVAIAVVDQAATDYRQRRPGAEIAAVGVTGMAEAGLMIGEDRQPVTPIIAWHDPRGAVAEVVGRLPDFAVRTGMAANPVPSIMKWPILLAAATSPPHRWLHVPEWIVVALGGEPVSERSLSARTGLFDLAADDWWGEAFDAVDAPRALLPDKPVLGIDGAGLASLASVADATLSVAGHDHQVAAYAVDAIGESSVFNSLGTAEALMRSIDRIPTPGEVEALTSRGYSVGATVVADRWAVLAGFRSGQILERIAVLLGVTEREARRKLGQQAADLETHAGLSIVRDEYRFAIEGLETVAGIEPGLGPAHLWRGAVESADARLGEALTLLDAMFGEATDVAVGGGWLNDPAVEAAKRRRFPHYREAPTGEAGAVGAALMALRAGGTAPDHRRTMSGETI